ncbi:hypothetical protein FS837_013043 [Tulasnella sp. UAMH 9824]|nr:hypothetical protein FS837_013043 [Tulasnella sp. UAMH 9824]
MANTPACLPWIQARHRLRARPSTKTANPFLVPGFTSSPLLMVSDAILYVMNNTSSLVGVEWCFSLPFLNVPEVPDVVDTVTSSLGTNLVGFKMANEPRHLREPQEEARSSSDFRTHSSAQRFWNAYIDSFPVIDAANKELIMPETNTASCGGFAGASDPYATGLYFIDLALSRCLHRHEPGSPSQLRFQPNLRPLNPSNNMSKFCRWTATPQDYPALIMSEVMEEEGSQAVDLLLERVTAPMPPATRSTRTFNPSSALSNYITDPRGANDAQFDLPNSQPSVMVKYPQHRNRFDRRQGPVNLCATNSAPTTAWRGEEADSNRPMQRRYLHSHRQAPRFALVFPHSQNSIDPVESTRTWRMSIATKFSGPAVVYPSVLAGTSEGRGGAQEAFNIGTTSPGAQVYGSYALRSVLASGALAGAVALVVDGWAVLDR